MLTAAPFVQPLTIQGLGTSRLGRTPGPLEGAYAPQQSINDKVAGKNAMEPLRSRYERGRPGRRRPHGKA